MNQLKPSLRSLQLGLFAALLISACGGNGNGNGGDGISFTEGTEDEIQIALWVADGSIAFLPYFALVSASSDADTDGCPQKEVQGATTTFIGNGCTAASSGTQYSGKAIATNLSLNFGFDEVDSDLPSEMRFEDFAVTEEEDGLQSTYNGSISQSLSEPLNRDYTSETHFSIVGESGLSANVDTELSCSPTENEGNLCTHGPNSSGDVGRFGRFAIRGFADPTNGLAELELIGADTFAINYSDIEGGCVPYTVDGVMGGSICQ